LSIEDVNLLSQAPTPVRPESILTKPGALTVAERARIEQHTIIGDQILAALAFLGEARPLVRHGHERWDGAGYPDGLAGEQIPLGSSTR